MNSRQSFATRKALIRCSRPFVAGFTLCATVNGSFLEGHPAEFGQVQAFEMRKAAAQSRHS
jgi:hypothetical protein